LWGMVGIVGDYHELLLVLLLYVRQLVWRGSSQPTDHDRPTDQAPFDPMIPNPISTTPITQIVNLNSKKKKAFGAWCFC
jgi:hypothetical protein